ncbi:hypothetical protein KIW84_074947 [Lathyrus oleraceus]|uniref:Uncharacterized protein n=1 Tax=Pisum sativum TaxID=3888 RepID=A0A9D4VVG1_PEA|nr:hypothetical protein KIW84_074947 [Pisum sativum]
MTFTVPMYNSSRLQVELLSRLHSPYLLALLGYSITNHTAIIHVNREPAKVTVEKDRSVVDAAILLEIDRTMKKHMDNLHHVLEGVSARLTKLESRTHHLESAMDGLKACVGNNHGTTNGKLRLLENILYEVQTGVQNIKDKQDIVQAQLQLAKLQVSKTGQQSKPQASAVSDPVQQASSAPQQSQQHLPSSFNLPQSTPVISPPNAPYNLFIKNQAP